MSNNTITFGEVDYNTDSFGGDKKQTNSKDLFLRLQEGSNELRLVTSPFQYLVHKYKKEGDAGFGQKVGCSIMHGACPLCALGDKAKARWFYGVIDRKTGLYKILDVSFSVFGSIRKLARNTQRWGDPTKYDIDIVVDKNGGATGYYSVQPISKEPLSATDQQIKDNADLEDLKRRCTPPTAEQVQKRMDKINGTVYTDASPVTGKKAATKSAAKVPTVTMTDENDLSEEFPAYAGEEQA
jgi:hypothetical protein